MLRAICAALVLSAFIACGGAPPPTRSNAQPFSVISEQADSAAHTLTVLIRVSGPATEANVKPIAESVIASRNAGYPRIFVKSYLEGAGSGDLPFAISRLEDGVITHHFNSMAETEKIKTH